MLIKRPDVRSSCSSGYSGVATAGGTGAVPARHSGPRHMIIEMLGTIVCASREVRRHDGPRCCSDVALATVGAVMPQPSPKRTPWLHRDRGAGGTLFPHPAMLSQAGYPAQWIQYPYRRGRKGRLTVVAKVRRPQAHQGPQRPQAGHADPAGGRGQRKYSKVKKPRSVGVLPDSALLTRAHKKRR